MAVLLVASTGGHLSELHALWPRLQQHDEEAPLWVTFDTPQSRSLLAGSRVEFLRYIAPRDVRNTARNLNHARRIIGRHRPSEVFSTGSGIALAVLPPALVSGARCHYIESAARSHGPSLTGRALEAVPGIKLYRQYEEWPSRAGRQWRFAGSIFDAFTVVDGGPTPLRRVLVSLGTIPYEFHRLVQQIESVVPASCEIVWQLGHTRPQHVRRGRVHGFLSADVLAQLCADVDVVVTHAGVGSSLMALHAGKTPVLVPREPRKGEHVDGHQQLIANALSQRGLAVQPGSTGVSSSDLVRAGKGVAMLVSSPSPLRVERRPRHTPQTCGTEA